ncbi:MAG: M24 family metallopeptidase [Ignavibacteriaceae bacterium]|nr:M24 family metallopeptidase [Ignavibacteriaceae bacterium]
MKKNIYYLLTAVTFFLVSCEKSGDGQSSISEKIWKNPPSNILTDEEIKDEIEQKLEMLNSFLDENNLGGMLFTQVRNVNWITAGLANTQIVLNKDIGAASLLIMRDGKKYLICNGSESGRLMDEVLGKLGYQLKQYNWYEANSIKDVREEIIREISAKLRIGSDTQFPGTVAMADKFKPLRYSLLPSEIKRYKWLGQQTTEAVAQICKTIKPGMNEFEIEAITSAELRSRGIFPTVLLIGVDERIFSYRHCLPNGASLKKYAMINVVAEKWGMPVAVTRFVHFGKLSPELKNKIEKTAFINAKYQEATVPGKKLRDIWDECKSWYSEAGFTDEWMKHHQGGAIGYDDREYVNYPENENVIQEFQGFAWNPTITGAKVEETMIVSKDGFEVITKSEDWPMINVVLKGKSYPQPDILIRDEASGEIIKQEVRTIEAEK